VPEHEPVLVDTDVASALYLERYYDRRVSASLAGSLATRRLAISLITLGEAYYGVRKRKWGPPRTTRMLAFYQEMFDVVPLANDTTAAEYGLLAAGRCLAEVGRPGAHERLADARAVFADLGAPPLLALADARLAEIERSG
jgi:predicted nucleic acid-binding protein